MQNILAHQSAKQRTYMWELCFPKLKGDKILNQACRANVELSPLDHTKDTSLGVRNLGVDIKYGTYYL
jgi:hypothetical protein